MLKRLELLGFKSFAHRSVFEFEPGICALVGPNGSGKSNVADAVRWVLGEQSARALRGKRAEEVIFVGSAERHALGMAEVALVLDNNDRRLPLEFAEVRVARRLFRSGESEYLINGARARRKDLVSLLLEVGLHNEGYTVIGQGAVEELVIQRPEERRAVLEHASDISRHQARLADARSKLAATEANLIRSEDLIAELEPHARRLRSQAQKAERYAGRRGELAALARAYFRAALAEKQTEHKRAAANLRQSTAECGRLENEIAASEDERRGARGALARLDEQLAERRLRLEQLHRERDGCLAALATGRQRAGFVEARGEALAGDVDRLESEIGRLSNLNVGNGAEVGASDVSFSVGALQRLDQELEGMSGELRHQRSLVADLRREQNELAKLREQLRRQLDSSRERRAAQQRAEAEAVARRSELDRAVSETDRQIEELEQHVVSGTAILEEVTGRLDQARGAREQAQAWLAAARDRENMLAGELEVARARLADLLVVAKDSGSIDGGPGLVGRLGSYLRVPPEYEPAIAAALGEWACADLLERGPLEASAIRTDANRSLVVAPLEGSGYKAGNGRTFAAELARWLPDIWHQPAYLVVDQPTNGPERAPLGPLCFTVLVRDLDDALTAARRLGPAMEAPWQIATLSGQVVTHFGGAASGSESTNERLVTRRRREAEYQSKVDDLRAAVELAAKQRSATERDLASAVTHEHEAHAAAIAAQTDARHLAQRIESLKSSRRRLDEERACQRTVQSESSSDEIVVDDRQLDEQVRRSTLLGEQETSAAEALQLLQTRWEITFGERDELRRKTQQEAAEQSARRQLAESRARDLERAHGERQSAVERARQVSEEKTQLAVRIEALDRQADSLANEIGETGHKVAILAAERDRHLGSSDTIEAALAERRKALATARGSREAMLVASQQLADALDRLRQEADSMADEWELVGQSTVQLRLPGDADRVMAATDLPPEHEIDLASTRRRLVALQRELRSYGPVGDSVLDEYREVNDRLEFLVDQSADLRAAMSELEGVVVELEGLMREGFSLAFQRVNAAFEKTFSTLFGGGTARLVLTEPSDPLRSGVDIVAQPPGKRLQNQMSLSGGERALTSTALIFALLAINPLPFCVLDEVDAAFDESNALRFAALLKDYARRTQFIIITHNRATMEIAGALYGLSMGGDGVTSVVSLRLAETLDQPPNAQVADGSESVLQAR